MTCADEKAAPAERAAPLRGRASVSCGFSRAHLYFFDDQDFVFDKAACLASSDLFLGRFTLGLGAGPIPWGAIDGAGSRWEVGPGWVASSSLSWRVLEDEGPLPYVVLSAIVAGAGVSTRRGDDRGQYLGIDFRFGATLGKTFFGWLSPYVALRGFGGPIFWTTADGTEVGTDKYHVQGGLGAVFLLPGRLDLFVEGNPGGELGGFGGLGLSY